MGNSSSGYVQQHLQTAEKTGALTLSGKKFEKWPEELFQRNITLRSLDISANKLKDIPQQIKKFGNLKHVNLSSNRITSGIEVLGELKKLEQINLSANSLREIPSTFAGLRHGNNIKEFPLVLCGLTSLDFLDLSSNELTQIPEGVSGLQVSELNANQNQISRLSEDVARCPRLKTLRLEENCLQLEAIPKALLASSNVSLLAVEGNLFSTKALSEVEGYENYTERYTSTRRKML
ncbi:unnamed protein product [Darwinula stevensoni]|uniref:Leucine-rich repeat-containing protein 57 n=1 Tax=Darwinula stevensoni TaxID=69355 RepID=A0A7R9AAN6_9CRUS|nr:unnamed protein product [Darwinula stevensoni]CAG0898632.1 unnamed protein product [Darwinula stevensoni]